MTGCTYGKGNLFHLDYGKNAFTFIRRSDGKAIRIATRPEGWGELTPEQEALIARARGGEATEAEKEAFHRLHRQRSQDILERPLEQIFSITPVAPQMPARARLHNSVVCAGCGEGVMETRSRLFRGENYCIPCFEARDRRYT